MSDQVFNIVLSVASGCIGLGVLILIRINFLIADRLNKMDVKLSEQGVKVDYIEKEIEKHDRLIVEMQTK